eukprot:c6690_g1_i1 orf=332-1858(+)
MDDMGENTIETTPTWALASVLVVFVTLSCVVERAIQKASQWLNQIKRTALSKALEKMKAELMLLGFMSLIISAGSNIASGICISSYFYGKDFLPCSVPSTQEKSSSRNEEFLRRNTTHDAYALSDERRCAPGYEPFVSQDALHQLDRFIFVMAVTHLLYSCLTMLFASFKVYGWKKWEVEAHSDFDDSLADMSRIDTMKRQSAFANSVKYGPWSSSNLIVLVICFLRQFGQSVTRVDYFTLRLGFITSHNLSKDFDFHNYMVHSTEDEFQDIVGISGPLWGFVVAFMLLNVSGSNLYFWISFIPVTILLVVGAKLQYIIATLTLENARLTSCIESDIVKPSDKLFWFRKTEFLLQLIHFSLFQSAFELGTFFWFWWEFGYNSCFLKKGMIVYIRLFMGFISIFLFSYSILPLYALVAQMGSNYKVELVPDKIKASMHSWENAAKWKLGHGGGSDAIIEDTGIKLNKNPFLHAAGTPAQINSEAASVVPVHRGFSIVYNHPKMDATSDV